MGEAGSKKPGLKGAGSRWETGEERVGSGITKVEGTQE